MHADNIQTVTCCAQICHKCCNCWDLRFSYHNIAPNYALTMAPYYCLACIHVQMLCLRIRNAQYVLLLAKPCQCSTTQRKRENVIATWQEGSISFFSGHVHFVSTLHTLHKWLARQSVTLCQNLYQTNFAFLFFLPFSAMCQTFFIKTFFFSFQKMKTFSVALFRLLSCKSEATKMMPLRCDAKHMKHMRNYSILAAWRPFSIQILRFKHFILKLLRFWLINEFDQKIQNSVHIFLCPLTGDHQLGLAIER